MGDFTPVLVAVVTTLGTIVVAAIASRSGRVPPLLAKAPSITVEEAAALREAMELAEARAEAWREKYTAELEAHAATRLAREFAERSSDECDRRLNALYHELRMTGRVVDRRAEPRDELPPGPAQAAGGG